MVQTSMIMVEELGVALIFVRWSLDERERRWFVWHGILFEEPNPTGSRPRDLIGLYRQQKKPHPPNTQGRARREHGGEQGHPEEAESHPEEAERRKKDRKREVSQRKP